MITGTRLFSLLRESADRLDDARSSVDGRSAVSLHQGESCVLRQTVTSLLATRRMEVEHPPEEAWILVLEGHIELNYPTSAEAATECLPGDLLQLPQESFTLDALKDSVVLLTVAKGDRPT